MARWLYNPKNDYKGRIFWDEDEAREYEAQGWENAPYPSTNLVKTEDNPPIITEKLLSQAKPGRKPGAKTKRGG
jgi:hypothetical protein